MSMAPDIDEALGEELNPDLARQEEILRAIVEFSLSDIFDRQGVIMPPHKWPPRASLAIKTVRLGQNGKVTSVDPHDRLKASSDLAKIEDLRRKAGDGGFLAKVPRRVLRAIRTELDAIAHEEAMGR